MTFSLALLSVPRASWHHRTRVICRVYSSSIQSQTFLFGNNAPSFEECGISNKLSVALNKSGFSKASIVQQNSMPSIINGKDTILAAETGSGKTLSYLAPILDKCINECEKDRDHIFASAVILVPNKQLCHQVFECASSIIRNLPNMSRPLNVGAMTLASGSWPYTHVQMSPDLVITTPAVIAKYLRGPKVLEPEFFANIRYLVMDEADMLVEGSFHDDIESILGALKVVRRQKIAQGLLKPHEPSVQYILSAATIPTVGSKSVKNEIIKRFPNATLISQEHLHKQHPRINQTFVEMPNADLFSPERLDFLYNLIIQPPHCLSNRSNSEAMDAVAEEHEPPMVGCIQSGTLAEISAKLVGISGKKKDEGTSFPSTLVFVNTALAAKELNDYLVSRGLYSLPFHKSLTAIQKQDHLQQFRQGKCKLLVATDHLARGLDIPEVSRVIQAEMALNVVDHLHRIGRASRGGRMGWSWALYGPDRKDFMDCMLSAVNVDVDVAMDDDVDRSTEDTMDVQGQRKSESNAAGMTPSADESDSSVSSFKSSRQNREQWLQRSQVEKNQIDQVFSRKRGFRQKMKRRSDRHLSNESSE